jgi:NitT/TauT family transport system substrate-binding protein
MKPTIIVILVLAGWLATSVPVAVAPPRADAQPRKVTVQMDWVIGGAHGGFFVAKDRGFYAARGLDVTISRGFGSGDTIKVVAAGKLDFGFANIPAGLVSRGKGAPVKQIAVVIGKAPESFVSFEEKGIRSLKDLEGKSFLEAAGAATMVTWPAFAKLAGIDVNKMTFIAVEPAAKPAAFFGGRGDLAFGFRPGFDEPVIVRARREGKKLVYLRWEDYGWKVYGSGIVTNEALLRRDPKLAADFVAATMEGYRWAMENHEQALELFLKVNPEVDKDAARLGLMIAIDGLLTKPGRENGLGYMDPDRMAFQIDMMAKLNDFPRPSADEVYTNEFIKKIPFTVSPALQAEIAKLP